MHDCHVPSCDLVKLCRTCEHLVITISYMHEASYVVLGNGTYMGVRCEDWNT